jgi:TonB family protein
VKALVAIGLPVIYVAAVYFSTRPPKPVYTLANKTVITVTETAGPAALHAPDPEYPPQALREGIEGTVKLKVTIASDGTVANAIALSGPELLRPAATRAVLRWQFVPTAAVAEIEVPFLLRSAPRSIEEPRPLSAPPPASGRSKVRVVATVTPDGRVEFAYAVSGPSELMPAAVASVKKWVFRPLLRDGKPDHGTAVVEVSL